MYIIYNIYYKKGFGVMMLQGVVQINNYYVRDLLGLTGYLMFVGAQFGAIVIPLFEVHIENKKKKNNSLTVNIIKLFFYYNNNNSSFIFKLKKK